MTFNKMFKIDDKPKQSNLYGLRDLNPICNRLSVMSVHRYDGKREFVSTYENSDDATIAFEILAERMMKDDDTFFATITLMNLDEMYINTIVGKKRYDIREEGAEEIKNDCSFDSDISKDEYSKVKEVA